MNVELKQETGTASPSPQARNRDRNGIQAGLVVIALGVLYLIYLAIYLPFLPTAGGTVGHDYGLHFPNLLTGFYWHLQNGLFSIPWFSPGQCGGFPYFPDPNVAYFSVPQFMVFLVSPMRAVQFTFLLFSLIGLAGCYILMRGGFRSSRVAAVLAAGLFLFNGFFTTRMLVGHLTFHAFALTPLMIAALLPGLQGCGQWSRSRVGLAVRACIAGLCLAYMFQSGMVHGIPPVLLATVIIILIHALCFGWDWQPWLLLAAAGLLLSLALCAGKLVSELALLSNFPRDDYPLPGIAGLWTELRAILQALFLSPPGDAAEIATNSKWLLERHEWDYGVSLGAALVLVAVAAAFAVRRRDLKPLTTDRMLVLSGILILLLVPVAINFYQPEWNRFLKSLPYFGNSSNLLRFISAYIPVVTVVAGLALDRLPIGGPSAQPIRLLLAGSALCVMLLQTIGSDRSYYADDKKYPIAPVEAAYARASATRTIPGIKAIGGHGDRPSVTSNDAMIDGISQRDCYQPLLGYRLEKFPVAPLRPGPVIDPLGRDINMKNPACYVFPAENSCKPGDHFKIAELDKAVAFLAYRPFAFEQPLRQKLATWLSLIAMIGVIAMLFAATAVGLMKRIPGSGR
jgi:hypothetical protein